jgi:purine-nucleoside/S-methyl-5'-thioadenosine phosphorylase / adenosine deaminase
VGNGEITRVRQRKERARGAQQLESTRGSLTEAQLRRTASPNHLDAAPQNTLAVARPERFHCRFLRCESGRKRGRRIAPTPAVRDFAFREDAVNEPIAVALDRVRDTVDLGRIETQTYNVHNLSIVPPSCMKLPAVPDTFYWTYESWGPALRCRPLDGIAHHLFTTRQLRLSSPDDWHRLARAIGVADANLIALKQVHGRGVVVVRRGGRSSQGRHHDEARHEADVIVSDNPEAALAVRAADCVPLLVGDPKTGAVGAAHAGWRGTAAGAAAALVQALQREFGSSPADLVAVVGPSIGVCCYEVGSELVDAFAAAGHSRELIDRWFLAPPPRRGSRLRSRLHLDVWAANRDQLILTGVAAENVHVSGLCTANHLDILTSYRAEKEAAGRIAGVIRKTQTSNIE